MAEAAKSFKRVTKTIEVETEETVITLTLSPDEAQAVAAVLAKVGGAVEGTPREHLRTVAYALSSAGIGWRGSDVISKMTGSIYCHETPEAAARASRMRAQRETSAEPRPLAIGDKIRILVDDHQGARVLAGDVLTVNSVHGDKFSTNAPRSTFSLRWNFYLHTEGTGWERVTGDTETVDGVVYDLSAEYRDRDGDVWRFDRRPNGAVRGEYGLPRSIDNHSAPLRDVVRDYGPLTKI